MGFVFRFGMIFAIFVGWVTYYPFVIRNGYFTASVFLPFHLCNIMEILIVISLWSNNEEILDVIIYPLILGPFLALTHPLGTYQLGGFFAFYFVYYHTLLLITGFYYLYRTKCKTSHHRIIKGALFVFSCDTIAFIVNSLTGGNYMFIGETAGFQPIPYYTALFLLVWLFLTGFHFLFLFLSNKAASFLKAV